MRLLLDTCAVLWFLGNDPKLSAAARTAVLDPANERWLSPISLLEIAIKVRPRKLPLPRPYAAIFPTELNSKDIHLLPIEPEHIEPLTTLPMRHKDPFDRLIADVNRAVRFIRYHARDFHIHPRRIGVTGGSAGGHLSLMLGVAGDRGNRRSTDAVERTSSRVQAVACFFPPTDFLNYGAKGKVAFAEDGVLANYRPAIDVREFDKRTKRLEHLSDKEKLEALYRRVSPISHVSADTSPTLIIHGDADKLVPIQQAEVMVARLKKVGVPAKLVVKKGAGHGWGKMDSDMTAILDWFDRHLQEHSPPRQETNPTRSSRPDPN